MPWDRETRLATFMRKHRKAARMTQMELANSAGVGLRLVRDLEQGKPNLQMEKVNLLLAFFGHELAPLPVTKQSRTDA